MVPRLTTELHKGECGRIAVFGGCVLYIGAPYFAAISALRCGADLVHVFCEKAAGSVIKAVLTTRGRAGRGHASATAGQASEARVRLSVVSAGLQSRADSAPGAGPGVRDRGDRPGSALLCVLCLNCVEQWLPRLHCVVLGPGLGRNQSMLGR